MKRARIIPVLLLKEKGLYKTVKFSKDRYIGDPLNAVKIFNAKQCDELIILDILSSKNKQPILFSQIEEIASECFMPLAYGGGIKSLFEIEKILKLGVEKVVLNSVMFTNPEFLSIGVSEFGSSTIVVSVDLRKNFLGKYQVFSHSNQKVQVSDVFKFLDLIQDGGAGEVMINMVDLDGTQSGYDFELASRISEHLSIPVTWCGGCSNFEDMKNLLEKTQISAAAAGSYFVYWGALNAVLINYPNTDDIKNVKI